MSVLLLTTSPGDLDDMTMRALRAIEEVLGITIPGWFEVLDGWRDWSAAAAAGEWR
jgi:hypothetical protein